LSKATPAKITPAEENCTKFNGSVPNVIGEFVVNTQPVSANNVPSSTKQNTLAVTSDGSSKSTARVHAPAPTT
jgi:hypothetical protein